MCSCMQVLVVSVDAMVWVQEIEYALKNSAWSLVVIGKREQAIFVASLECR